MVSEKITSNAVAFNRTVAKYSPLHCETTFKHNLNCYNAVFQCSRKFLISSLISAANFSNSMSLFITPIVFGSKFDICSAILHLRNKI